MPCELLQQGSAISPCSAHLQTEAKTIKEDQIGIYIYLIYIYIFVGITSIVQELEYICISYHIIELHSYVQKPLEI